MARHGTIHSARSSTLVAFAVMMALQPLSAAAIPISSFYSDNTIKYYDERASEGCAVASNEVAMSAVGYDSAGTEAAGLANRAAAMKFLISKGLTATMAAGILGNLMQESTPAINPVKEERPGLDLGGKGIAQWTASRRLEFEAAATEAQVPTREAQVAGLSKTEKDAILTKAFTFNLNYLWKEATQRGDIERLKNDTKKETGDDAQVKAALISWERWFERAGVPVLEKRLEFANQAFKEYSGTNPTTVSADGTPGCTTGTEGAPSEQAAKIVTIAKGELGNKEVDGSCEKYLASCDDGDAWCAAFVQWVFDQAGLPIGGGNSSKGVGKWFDDNRQFYRLSENVPPQPGDIFVRGRNGSGTGWDGLGHIGIVTSVSGNTIVTIEGNSSNAVSQRTYDDYHDMAELIGFGRY